jgi:Rrf2 family protein
MLSQTAEHALRAVAYLATRTTDGPVPAQRVARDLGAPSNYLSKTLHALAREGILESRPGRNGGFLLALPAEELCLARVLDLFEEPVDPESVCLLGGRPCQDERPCLAHRKWRQILAARRAPLDGTTVAELLNPETPGYGSAPVSNGTRPGGRA